MTVVVGVIGVSKQAWLMIADVLTAAADAADDDELMMRMSSIAGRAMAVLLFSTGCQLLM